MFGHGAKVLVGPGRGHRFDMRSRSLLYGVRNRSSIVLGRYEPAVTAFLAERLASSLVFFDVGASTGYYSRVALNLMGPSARVIAFEPDPLLAVRLRQSFHDGRLRLRVEALGRDDHQALLERREGAASRIRGESVAVPGYAEAGEVPVRSLDRLLEVDEVPRPDLMKIDVEGGEMLVLEGMHRLLGQRPAAAIECHSMALLHDVLGLLRDSGYEHLEVTGGGDDVGPVAVLAAA